ncbi:MAG: glucosaminidase domain-containing protein [Fusobacteriaceae bacterium]
MPNDTKVKLPNVPSFVKNIVKSVGYAAENKFKHIAPAMTEFASTNAELTRDIYGKVRNYKATIKNVGRLVAGSEVFGASNNLLKNAIDDLKTGKLYNKDRENAIMDEVFGGGESDLFNIDTGFDNALNFDDTESDSSGDMAGFEAVARTSVRNADHVAEAIRKTTGASVSTLVQNQRDIANHQMILSTENMNITMSRLANLDQSVVNSANIIVDQLQNLITPTLQYYNDSMEKFTELNGYMKELTEINRNLYKAKNAEIGRKEFKEDEYANMVGTNGTVDISEYAKSVMGNVSKEFDSSTMGMMDMFGGPSGFLKMMSSSPLSVIPNMLVSLATPVAFKDSIEKLDKSIGGFFTSLIGKFTAWEDDESPIKRMLGKIFGLKVKNFESFDLGEYNVEMGSMDKMSHRTINTVIPTYLRQIVGLLGGEESTFDHKSGTFNNTAQMIKKYNTALENASTDGISEYTNKINERIDMLLESVTDINEVNKVKDDSKAILMKMVKSGGLYTNFKEKSIDDFESRMGSVNLKGGDQSFKIFSTIFDSLDTEDQLNFTNAINDSRENKRNIQKSIITDMYEKGFSSLFDGSHQGLSSKMDDKGRFSLSPLVEGSVDRYSRSSNEYLRDIKGILLRGIKVFSLGNRKGSSLGVLSSIDQDLVKHNSEKTDARIFRERTEQKDARTQDQRDKEIASKIDSGKISRNSLKDNIGDVEINAATKDNLRKKVEDKKEKEKKDDEESSFMYQMFGDTLIYTHIKDAKDWLQNTMDKPFSLLTKIADKGSEFLHQMVFGKAKGTDDESMKGLFETIKGKFDDIYGKVVGWVTDKLFNPLKEFFTGNGKDKEGLFLKFNRFIFNPITSSIAGFMGLDTAKYDVNDPESMAVMRTDMKSNFKEWSEKIGMTDMLKSAGVGGAAGLLVGSPLMGAMMGGAYGILKKSEGFQKMLFGEMGENNERSGGLISKEFSQDFKKKLPGMGIGAGIGAFLSSGIASFIPGLGILGSLFTPFGMIGGALTGMGLSIASQSDKFKTWLMGDLDENGERQGGVLSKSLSKNLGATMLKAGIGGAGGGFIGGKIGSLLGMGMSFIPGMGFLGSVMGPAGAIGGTIMGMGLGIASSTDKFKSMLFGEADSKTGERDGGLFNKSFRDKFKSILPKAGIGMLAGGLTFGKLFSLIGAGAAALVPGYGGIIGTVMGPAGVIGGSLMGLGVAIASSSDTFKERMFGKDEDGKPKPSVISNMTTWIEGKVLTPMKGWFDKTALNVAGFFKDSIAVPFSTALIPLKKEFKLMTDSMKDMFKSAWDTTTSAIGGIFEQHVGKPFGEVMEDKVLKPLKSWIGKIVGGIGKIFGGIITAPIKLLTSIAQSTYRKHTKDGDMDYGDEMGDERGKYERKVTFLDRVKGVVNTLFKTKSLNKTKDYAKEMFKGTKSGFGQAVKDNASGLKGVFDKASGTYTKVKDQLGDSLSAVTVTTFGMLNSAIEKLGGYLFGAADANRDNIDAQNEYTETIRQSTSSPIPGDSINDIVDGDREKQKEKDAETKNVRNLPAVVPGQKSNSKESEAKDTKEADRQSSQIAKTAGLKFDSYRGVSTTSLQRSASGIIINTLPDILKAINNINKNIDGQMDGVGDNLNRIRKMLGAVLGDAEGPDYENKGRTSLIGKLLDVVVAPFKFITSVATTMITAPFKLLGATIEGIATVTKTAVSGILSTANSIVKAIGSVASIGINLLTGAAKGIGSILTGAGAFIGSGFRFVGETALATGNLLRDGLFGAIKLAGGALVSFGKSIISMAATVVDVAAFVGKTIWGITKSIAKTGYDIIKGTIGFGLDMISGAIGKITGRPEKNEVYVKGGTLDKVIENKDLIATLEPLIMSVRPTKSAMRVFVENFSDMEKAKKAEDATNALGGSSPAGADTTVMGRMSQMITAIYASIFTPKLPESSSLGGLLTSGVPLIGYNGKSDKPKTGDGENNPKNTAENRLALADSIDMKNKTKDTAFHISGMSTALVTAQDKKLDAIRVRVVKSKDDEEGGIFGLLKKLLPGMSGALLALPALIAMLKDLFVDRNGPGSKDNMSTTEEAVRFGTSTMFKLPSVRAFIRDTADKLDDFIDDPKKVIRQVKNSKIGKFVSRTTAKIKNSKIGKSVGKAIKKVTTKVTKGVGKIVDDIIDLTNIKNSMKVFTEIFVETCNGMADRIDKIPLFKGTMSKAAGVLRKIAVDFAETVVKGPGFMKTVMAEMAKRGFTSMARVSVAVFRSMAKSFFPIVGFLEGFTQSQSWNGTVSSTLTEKLISGLTFALLDILQAAATAVTGLSAGTTFMINIAFLALQQTMPYWNGIWTSLLLKGLDKALGTEKEADFKARQLEGDNEYKIFRANQYKEKLQAAFDAKVKEGYTGDLATFEKEFGQSIVDTLDSKRDFIHNNYNKNEFSLVSPSTWLPGLKSTMNDLTGGVVGKAIGVVSRPYNKVKNKIQEGVDNVGKQIKDDASAVKNKVTGWYKTGKEKLGAGTDNISKQIKDDASAVKNKVTGWYKTGKEKLGAGTDNISKQIKDDMKSLTDTFKGWYESGVSKFNSTLSTITSGFTGGMSKITDTFKGWYDSGVKKFTESMSKITDTFKGWYDAGIKSTKDFFTDTKKSLIDSFKPILNFKDTMTDAFKSTVKLLGDDPNSPFKKIVDILEKVKTFFIGTGPDDKTTFIDAIKNGLSGLVPGWMSPSGKGSDKSEGFNPENSPSMAHTKPKPVKIKYSAFSQNDPKWANLDFSTGGKKETFSKAGCAPTVMAMLANSLGGQNTDPGKLTEDSLKHASQRGGVKLNYFGKSGHKYGLKMGNILTFGGDVILDEDLKPIGRTTGSLIASNTRLAVAHLKSGRPLVGLVDDGTSEHFVMATGITETGDIKLIDPADGKEYTQPQSKFFKSIKYGYTVDNKSKVLGDVKGIHDEVGGEVSAEVKTVAPSDPNVDPYKGIRAATGINLTKTPTVTQEEMIAKIKGMMAESKVESNVTKYVKLGVPPTDLGPYKIGKDLIIKNGEIVQFPTASLVGSTIDGRPAFYAGGQTDNELGVRMNYNSGKKGFIATMEPFARYMYENYNMRPGIALMQSAHETGWGNLMKGNIAFNMKYAQQENATPFIYRTGEGRDGKQYRVAAFANFPGLMESWKAHHKLMSGDSRYAGFIQNEWVSTDKAAEGLKSFAEDEKYVTLLKNLYKSAPSIEKDLGITGPKVGIHSPAGKGADKSDGLKPVNSPAKINKPVKEPVVKPVTPATPAVAGATPTIVPGDPATPAVAGATPTIVPGDPAKAAQPSEIKYTMFSQNDPKWANTDFNTGGKKEKFSKAGCAPTVMAMLANSLGGKTTDPAQLAEEALKHASETGGIKLDYFKKVGPTHGLTFGDMLTFGGDVILDEDLKPKGKMTDSLLTSNTKLAVDHLKSGKPMVGLVDDGKSKHFVLATGVTDKGDIKLIDPSDGKEYTQPQSKFFKAVKYGYTVQPTEATTAVTTGGVEGEKKEIGVGEAFFNGVKNLLTRGILSYDDLDVETVKSEAAGVFGVEAAGALTGVSSVTGINLTKTPTVTQEEMIAKVKKMMAESKVEANVKNNVRLGVAPTDLGPYKIGKDLIIKNGEIVQFPTASVVGSTKSGRPAFYAGHYKTNELGVRMNYGTDEKGFAATMEPFARYMYEHHNLRPGLAIIQSAHETSWGNAVKGNIAFNMKYANQANATPFIYRTAEGKDSKEYRVAAFANFPGLMESWKAHYNLMLKSKRYAGFLANQWESTDKAAESLKDFAEDEKYVTLLKRLFKKAPGIESKMGITGPKVGPPASTTPKAEDVKAVEVKPVEAKPAEVPAGKGAIGDIFSGFNINPVKLSGDTFKASLDQFKDTAIQGGLQSLSDKIAGDGQGVPLKETMYGAVGNLGSSALNSAGLSGVPAILNKARESYSKYNNRTYSGPASKYGKAQPKTFMQKILGWGGSMFETPQQKGLGKNKKPNSFLSNLLSPGTPTTTSPFMNGLFGFAKSLGSNMLNSAGLGFLPSLFNSARENYGAVKGGKKSMFNGIFDTAMLAGDAFGFSPITSMIRTFMDSSKAMSLNGDMSKDPLSMVYGGMNALRGPISNAVGSEYSGLADLGMNTFDRYMANRKQKSIVVDSKKFDEAQLGKMTLNAKRDTIGKIMKTDQFKSDPGIATALTSAIGNLDTMKEEQADSMLKILGQLLESNIKTNETITGLLKNQVGNTGGNNTVIVQGKNGNNSKNPNPNIGKSADDAFSLLEKVKLIAGQGM